MKKKEMMCFVIVYHGNKLVAQGMRNDDGESTYRYANKKGYSVRKWEMYGLSHFSELDTNTKNEIKQFIKGLR